jgi:pyruvate,water dikinase
MREEYAAGKHAAQKDADRLIAAVETRYGKRKARKLASDIKFYRDFVGLREAPKFFWIRRFWSYKKVLIEIADDLVKNGVIDAKDDIYYLYIDELRAAIATHKADKRAIAGRRGNYRHWQTLTPPRVIFSDGEVPQPIRKINANIPANALEGQGVSPGVVEGRARVITSITEAKLEKGDILVTKFTDPSWTPVFLTVKGLVTEIGGMMTHGTVVTREYGLPAVVGVTDATRLIKDGDMIRIDGSDGYVEVLRYNIKPF